MDDDQRVQMQMDVAEALADAWAEAAGLTDQIVNATSPMTLRSDTPEHVRRRFHERMQAQVFAIAQQAYIEGIDRGVRLVNDEIAAAKK